PLFDDTAWQTVRVPHDWAVCGPFDRDNDRHVGRIVEDGDAEETEHTGRTGGLPHVGSGYYRRRVLVPGADDGKIFRLEFDGVMSNSTVYVNGVRVGGWPYGYTSFAVDATDHIVPGGDNLICVAVRNDWNASRWYPGAGIYRAVRLVALERMHIAHNGVYVRTTMTGEESAELTIDVEIRDTAGTTGERPVLAHTVVDDTGAVVGWVNRAVSPGGDAGEGAADPVNGPRAVRTERATLRLAGVRRWDIDAPVLYTVETTLTVADRVLDRVDTVIGFREATFDPERGFVLNGRRRPIRGVCMHHDLGALGAAVHRRALERQLEILKSFGANALRTSHNPPAPELLDLCDRMGVIVMDEAFDEWRTPKVRNGYARLWDEWAEKDLAALVRRDRNHPSVVMWSIGNEVPDQATGDGAILARFLYDICKRLDPDRPVTCGFNSPQEAIANGLADVVDIQGWNYKPDLYETYHRQYPRYCMLGSETSSTVSSRGVYHFPVAMEGDTLHDDLQVSSYDLYAPSWATVVDIEFAAQRRCAFMGGEFVWTGFDYLGEPTPYKGAWPSRSSYFGIVDLCGFPKDRYYLYAAEWGDRPVLHLLPHWTWPGREGERIPVVCITTYRSAELFLNGTSLGLRKKGEFNAAAIDFSLEEEKNGGGAPPSLLRDHIADFRLIWDDVPYEAGTLKVVAYDGAGRPAEECVVETAGPAATLRATADRGRIAADGDDLAFVTVSVLDEEGRRVPTADNGVAFTVRGPGELIAVDNGNAASVEPFCGTKRKAFSGLCLAILRSVRGTPGDIVLSASSVGLRGAEVVVATV
ncbi:MAG: DUF4982 domain-containing protein, partial [Spirochaetales bacterium]|nr:DUF4982 domain-containing protein [Spirochaetales bacterium]